MNLQHIKNIIREQLNQLRNEAKKDCCDDLMGNITHKSDWPGNACPKSHIVVQCEMAPPRPNRSKQTLNEETKCPLSIQINCSNGTPCTASWQDGNGGSDGCVYSDCCGGGPQSIIPKGPNAPMAYQNKRR